LNGFGDRTQVRQMALTDSGDETTLYGAADGSTGSLFPLPDGGAARSFLVPTISLDESFPPGARVDLVRIDVEGAEPLVWRGMQRVLLDNPSIEVILSWSHSRLRRTGHDPTVFMSEIRAAGFSIFVVTNDAPAGHLAPLPEPMPEIDATSLLLTRAPRTLSL
jgi:hypothetical protein